ncbi:SDR family NAD(P)-dependent oxidoreductase, partial [Sulfurimonas sp.]|uniref:SDR family NAD(P)-dependent oxidoreductase n=1 Tax=Sulfurimonas sp. TaxID=2022749 RepID=UPI00262044EA
MKILITGASSGLGAEFARQYASKENELFLLARREERLVRLKNELQDRCKNITLICVDVTAFEALQKEMKKLHDIDM